MRFSIAVNVVLTISHVYGLTSRKFVEIADCFWDEPLELQDLEKPCVERTVALGQENDLHDFKLLIPSDAAHEWAMEMDPSARMAIKAKINAVENGKLIAKFVPRGLLTLESAIWDCKTLVEDPTFDGFEIQLTSDLFEPATPHKDGERESTSVVPSQKQLNALIDFIRSCRGAEVIRGQEVYDEVDDQQLYLGVSVDSNLLDLEMTKSTKLIDTLRQLRDDLDAINVAYSVDARDSDTSSSVYYPDIFVGLKSTRPTVAVDTLSAILGPKVGVELDATAASAENILKDVCLAERNIKFAGDVTLVNWRGGEGLTKHCSAVVEQGDFDASATLMKWVKATPAAALAPSKGLRSTSRHH